jgi:tripartite-type tricarboxylate transporter receptor subunit TctC
MKRRDVLRTMGAALAAGPALLAAQSASQKPTRIVVPFPAGGTMDFVVRLVANDLSKRASQVVIVENKPGAGTVIGVDSVAKSPPDGHSLVAIGNSFTVNHTLVANLPYRSLEDLRPVTLLTRTPNVLVGRPTLAPKTLPELIAAAKAEKTPFTYASVGNGSIQHLAGEMLKSSARIDLTHVPYKGQAPALNDLLGGQVDLMFGNLPELLPQVQAGKLRAYGVSTAARAPLAPDIPTIAEQGIAGFETVAWFGLLAPAGVDDATVNRLSEQVKAALLSPENLKLLTDRGLEPIPCSPAVFGEFLRSEMAKYAAVIKRANVKID